MALGRGKMGPRRTSAQRSTQEQVSIEKGNFYFSKLVSGAKGKVVCTRIGEGGRAALEVALFLLL